MGLSTYPLGRSGLQITRVGFGAWAVGGGWSFGWGPQDDADSLATMRHALELGMSWIDTAAADGLGHSEQVVGRLLRGLPSSERPFVFTKCGLLWDEHKPMAPPRRALTPDSIRRECEASCVGSESSASISISSTGRTRPGQRSKTRGAGW